MWLLWLEIEAVLWQVCVACAVVRNVLLMAFRSRRCVLLQGYLKDHSNRFWKR